GPRVMKLRRPVCILLAFASIIFILFLVVQMVIPELISCLQLLFSRLPGAFEQGAAWLEENFELTSMLQNQAVTLPGSEAEWQELLGKLAGTLVSGAGNIMGIAVDVISSAVSKTINVAVAAVFSIYLLAGKEKIGEQIGKLMGVYLPRRISGGIGYVLQVLDSSFHHFIVGQCVEAVILGLLCVAGMLLLRLPYAAMLGSLVGVTALIPVAGAYIGGAVGFFMIFTVDPIKAVFFLIFLVALQQLEGNLIYPRVVGSSIGLPGIWVLAAVTVGGGVAGVGGMLLGVPVTATVYQLLKNDVQKKTLPKSKKSD
ncbi:MAG: AI-2E family transporter, partial [Lachnospiraceae bacterium]|nr:AI-2E family transporter [Lachnospiraceae bacterium]